VLISIVLTLITTIFNSKTTQQTQEQQHAECAKLQNTCPERTCRIRETDIISKSKASSQNHNETKSEKYTETRSQATIKQLKSQTSITSKITNQKITMRQDHKQLSSGCGVCWPAS
jgi:predicted Holliday junction resolvase-like endonuclease